MRKRALGMLSITILMLGLLFPPLEAGAAAISDYSGPSGWRDLDAPYNLRADYSDEEVRLTWRNPQDGETDITIERKSSDASFREIAIVAGDVTRYTDDSISPDTDYIYRVRAWRDGRSSPPSNEVQVYLEDEGDDDWDQHHWVWEDDCLDTEGPSNLRASVLSYSSISLTWDDSSFPALGYRVERRSNSGSFVTVANLGCRDRSFTDRGLDRHTRYCYRVRAYNLLRDSDYSDEIWICTSNYFDDDDWYWSDDRYYDDYYDESGPVVIKLQVGSRTYYVNDTREVMDTAPFIIDGRTLVPIRFLAESIGAGVDWDDYTRKATVTHDGEVIELWAGRSTARVSGARTDIDPYNAQLSPMILNGRIMLPLRFVTENLGFDVYWNDSSQEIILTYFD